jgi:salicylate hydroxylase
VPDSAPLLLQRDVIKAGLGPIATPTDLHLGGNDDIKAEMSPSARHHLSMLSSNDEGLSVIVVGAGIAGLTVARGLRERHRVTIIESSKFKNEIGAAVHLAPNVTKILLRWGIDLNIIKPVEAKRIILEKDYQNNVLADITIDPMKLFGSPWWYVHRVDLHNALRKLATDPAGPGKPAEIILGKAVTGCDCDAGVVTLDDGTTMKADLIVGESIAIRS